jgi:hypothetical protein
VSKRKRKRHSQMTEALENISSDAFASHPGRSPDVLVEGYETAQTLYLKLPIRGARLPNADEQAGDWGSEDCE